MSYVVPIILAPWIDSGLFGPFTWLGATDHAVFSAIGYLGRLGLYNEVQGEHLRAANKDGRPTVSVKASSVPGDERV